MPNVSVHAPSRRKRKRAMRSRAFLNGVEVTSDCQRADTRIGRVLLVKRNEDGRRYPDPRTGTVAREWKHGRVEVRPKCR